MKRSYHLTEFDLFKDLEILVLIRINPFLSGILVKTTCMHSFVRSFDEKKSLKMFYRFKKYLFISSTLFFLTEIESVRSLSM